MDILKRSLPSSAASRATMPASNGVSQSLSHAHRYASSNDSADTPSKGDKSVSSGERPASNSTDLTEPDDVTASSAKAKVCESQLKSQAKQKQPAASKARVVPPASAAHSMPRENQESTLKSGARIPSRPEASDALQTSARSWTRRNQKSASNGGSSYAKSTSSEVSQSAKLAAQSSPTRDRFPVQTSSKAGKIASKHSSSPNSASLARPSASGKPGSSAPPIRHAQRDMHFSLPISIRPDVALELRKARLELAGGGNGFSNSSDPKTSMSDLHLRHRLATVSNHQNLLLNQQTLLEYSSSFGLPIPTTPGDVDALRAIIHAAQQAMRGYSQDGLSTNGLPIPQGKFSTGNAKETARNDTRMSKSLKVKNNASYFSHHSIPDIRSSSNSNEGPKRAEQRESYNYRGALDVAYVPRAAQHVGSLQPFSIRASDVAPAKTSTSPSLHRIRPTMTDRDLADSGLQLLEVQVVQQKSQPAAITDGLPSRRRRWSTSEGSSLTFNYKLANNGDAMLTRSFQPVPQSQGYDQARSRDSVLCSGSKRWSGRTPSIKSTSTEYWNEVYSGKQNMLVRASHHNEARCAAHHDEPTNDANTTEAIDWAQLSSPMSERARSQFSFTSAQAREWAHRPRVDSQSSRFAFRASQDRGSSHAARSATQPERSGRRNSAWTSLAHSDPRRLSVAEDGPNSKNGHANDTDLDDPEIEVIPRELPSTANRPISSVSSVHIDALFKMAGGFSAGSQPVDANHWRQFKAPSRAGSIRSWWYGEGDQK